MIDNEGVLSEPAPDCVRCGTPGAPVHEALRDPIFGAPGSWTLRRCAKPACGLAWIDPQPRADQIGKFYASYYTHGPSEQNPHLVAIASPKKRRIKALLALVLFWRRRLFASDLFFLQGMAPGRVLDVGCGNGDFLIAARAFGWSPTGIDFDESAVARANEMPGVSARAGDLVSCGFESESFDAVVLNNVIEHLPNTAEVFAECRRVLRPGGRLVMMTPNPDAIGHTMFGRDWRGLEPPRHLYLFTPALIGRYAREAGFGRIETFSYAAGAGSEPNILPTSAGLAKAAGRPARPINLKAVERREKLLDLVGIRRGEFTMLVAHR